MQITINIPDNVSSEKVEQLIQEIEQRFLKEAVLTTLKKQRPIGLAKSQFKVPPAFFEPLPDDLINAFEGYEK
jgi:hypothetical protein